MSVLFFVTFHPLCGLTKYTVVGTALGPTSVVGMLAVGPGASQTLFSQGHQCGSTEVVSQDCSSCTPGPAMGAMEAAQTLAWTNPCVYAPSKPIAAKARPVPATGAPVVRSDVPQALNSQSWQCRRKSVVCTVVGRDFSSAS